MTRTNIIKLILTILLAIAIALGFYRSNRDPLTQGGHISNTGIAADKTLEQYLKEAGELSDKNSAAVATTTVSFLAVGDIMLSRNVAAKIESLTRPLYGPGPETMVLQGMDEILKLTDFNFANLESPFDPNDRGIVGGHSLIFAVPTKYSGLFSFYNFKILNLANNHALDQGLKGLKKTVSILDQNKIKHVGIGEDIKSAWQSASIYTHGINICFVGASYASINDNGKTTNNYVARIEDLANLKFQISNSQKSCDFTVVTMHAGTEYTRKPNKSQVDFAHAAIDYGADMVIGAHPHWVQTIEKYNNKYIFYSLGNFIFDQEWSQDTKEGLALKILISKSGQCSVPIYGQTKEADESARYNCPSLQGPRQPAKLEQIELIPVIIENYSTPRPATADEAKKILNKIGETEKILQ